MGTRRVWTVQEAKMPMRRGFQRNGWGYDCPALLCRESGGLSEKQSVSSGIHVERVRKYQAKVTRRTSPRRKNVVMMGTSR